MCQEINSAYILITILLKKMTDMVVNPVVAPANPEDSIFAQKRVNNSDNASKRQEVFTVRQIVLLRARAKINSHFRRPDLG